MGAAVSDANVQRGEGLQSAEANVQRGEGLQSAEANVQRGDGPQSAEENILQGDRLQSANANVLRGCSPAEVLAASIYRDTAAEVSLGAIRGNAAAVRAALPAGVRLMAVVKADGYGHGGAVSARMAEEGGAELLATAYLEEALGLRAAGIRLPILVLTPIRPEDAALAAEHDLMLTVAGADWLRQMQECRPWRLRQASDGGLPLKIHIKADTGLGRLGIRSKAEWDELAPLLRGGGVVVDGFYTHFATAGLEDVTYLLRQHARFMEMKEWVRESGIEVGSWHCAGSAAALRFPWLAMDMVRIGAALYGFGPKRAVDSLQLRPAMKLRSRLLQTKLLRKGEVIGYDNSYEADEDQWIGTVPIGYADGWTQSFRGSEMLVEGRRVPIVGKICMDQLMVRLPGPCPPGAEAVLIGSQGDECVSCADLAAYLGTVPQEVTTGLSGRIKRIYTE
mgnify:CR=1 FL=1|jgi:alanine racemase